MKTYDPACEDLAELFIEDPPQRSRLLKVGFDQVELDALRRRLAEHIQDAVEGWFTVLDDEIREREHKPLAKSEPATESD